MNLFLGRLTKSNAEDFLFQQQGLFMRSFIDILLVTQSISVLGPTIHG